MDFGFIFFFFFMAFWIFFIRTQSKRRGSARPKLASRSFPGSHSERPRQLTLVGIEEHQEAVTGLMAVTGVTRAEAEARLANLPTTIPVAPGDYAASLEILAESGIAYATGPLGREDPFSIMPKPRPAQPMPVPPPTSARPAPPSASAPPPSSPPERVDTPAAPSPPPTLPAGEEPTTPTAASVPPLDVPVQPDHEPADESVPAPVWAVVDTSTVAPEVAAAMTHSDRNVAERNLRRLSMNGVHEAEVALGNLLIEWGRTSEAEGMLRGRGYDDPVAANNLGVLDELEGRDSAARRNYERAAELGSAEGSTNLTRLEA